MPPYVRLFRKPGNLKDPTILPSVRGKSGRTERSRRRRCRFPLSPDQALGTTRGYRLRNPFPDSFNANHMQNS